MQHHFLSRQAIIEWLIIEREGTTSSEHLVTGVFSSDWTDESFAAFEARQELQEASDDALAGMYDEKFAEHCAILQAAKTNMQAGLFFNKPGAFADFGFFARQLIWTFEDTVALSLGRRPDI